MASDILYLGYTTFRNQFKKFGIKLEDRRRHIYVLGKTGMGKTSLLLNMAIQDILANKGIGFIDPHGEAAEELLHFIPSRRINDVVYFNPADVEYPIAFNVMEKVSPEYKHLIASGLMGVFKKIWPDVWSARMEYILNNTTLALLEYPNTTVLAINRMLADPAYRKKVIEKITDPVVKSFWVNEFARYTQRYEVEATAAIQNKIGQFISNPLIRNIIGQVKSRIDIRKIMDEGKILIANLSKGKIGEDNSKLLGALLITKLQLAAMSRVDVPEEQRKDFFLYVDEFQNFATEAFVNILSEARKYRLSLILANQYLGQLDEMTPFGKSTKIREAIFGNVGTTIVFRVGAEDAFFLEKEFYPEVKADDLINLPKYNIFVKLMIDGITTPPFSAQTLPPPKRLTKTNLEKIILISRERYGVKREVIEGKIEKWMEIKETLTSSEIIPQKTVLFDAQCALCKKLIKVPFEPDPQKPVYCKSCLKKMGKEKEEKEISLKEIVKKESGSKSEREIKKKKTRVKADIERLKETLKKALERDNETKRG
jgi:CxxC-x17-CxxC domain-containing protein